MAEPEKEEQLYVVRHFDGFDETWIDITKKPVTHAEAQRIWNERTKNGTEHCKFGDIDKFRVFPAE